MVWDIWALVPMETICQTCIVLTMITTKLFNGTCSHCIMILSCFWTCMVIFELQCKYHWKLLQSIPYLYLKESFTLTDKIACTNINELYRHMTSWPHLPYKLNDRAIQLTSDTHKVLSLIRDFSSLSSG